MWVRVFGISSVDDVELGLLRVWIGFAELLMWVWVFEISSVDDVVVMAVPASTASSKFFEFLLVALSRFLTDLRISSFFVLRSVKNPGEEKKKMIVESVCKWIKPGCN
ncbi:hypothetical protein OIU74_022407 [Salix koriyanagi]|uniref:Uncharacterized protein n=1 Tax=Salix koriyanagi TaxID=2511006 RepID=A0A9Q1AEQ1_9ROSI|nr:hypothetical protein OIU74_022407 [Salix koriyanagi]